jgi:hypothetical protein
LLGYLEIKVKISLMLIKKISKSRRKKNRKNNKEKNKMYENI